MKAIAVLLALSSLCMGGCATVRPWERERLAARGMQLDADPLGDEMDDHVYEVREGANGGASAGGGGCGCN